MAKIILRVDDCGWVPPEKSDDRDLVYFRKWREAFGIAGLPVYYGFIPTTLGLRELRWLYENLPPAEQVSVHGWDHERGRVPGECMSFAAEMFVKAVLMDDYWRSYIPPFNAYDCGTIRDWHRAAGATWGEQPLPQPVFFGGFPDDGQSLDFGPEPRMVDGVLHIPAYRPLYGRVEELIPELPKHLGYDYPIVLTLHATWDVNRLDQLRTLRDLIALHLVPVSEAMDWTKGRHG
jgi:hypothetical protein